MSYFQVKDMAMDAHNCDSCSNVPSSQRCRKCTSICIKPKYSDLLVRDSSGLLIYDSMNVIVTLTLQTVYLSAKYCRRRCLAGPLELEMVTDRQCLPLPGVPFRRPTEKSRFIFGNGSR